MIDISDLDLSGIQVFERGKARMYHKVPEKPTVYFDVDSTLVFAWSDITDDLARQLSSVFINNEIFYIHDKHIQKIKEFKARNHQVVVWSAGGADWAEAVVKALQLTDLVDVVMSKPDWYFDDLSVDEWIGRRCYVKLNDTERGF